jgi:hypothetical protein
MVTTDTNNFFKQLNNKNLPHGAWSLMDTSIVRRIKHTMTDDFIFNGMNGLVFKIPLYIVLPIVQ